VTAWLDGGAGLRFFVSARRRAEQGLSIAFTYPLAGKRGGFELSTPLYVYTRTRGFRRTPGFLGPPSAARATKANRLRQSPAAVLACLPAGWRLTRLISSRRVPGSSKQEVRDERGRSLLVQHIENLFRDALDRGTAGRRAALGLPENACPEERTRTCCALSASPPPDRGRHSHVTPVGHAATMSAIATSQRARGAKPECFEYDNQLNHRTGWVGHQAIPVAVRVSDGVRTGG